MTSWYAMLKEKMEGDGEVFEDKKCTLTDTQLKVRFEDGYVGEEGAPFTAWGEDWVYFPICCDGWELVGHAPRNPCNLAMTHQGG